METSKPIKKKQPRSHLFLVRMWQEELGDGQVEWRGRALNIAAGNALYFREWEGLVEAMRRAIQDQKDDAERDTSVSE